MKFFRLRRKPESGEEEKELVLDTDAEAEAAAQGEAPAPEGDLLTQIGAEADSEIEAEGDSLQQDDSLDPGLLDIFRDAKNEVQEITLASELEDIPIQDLLSDLVGVSHRLRAMPRTPAEPGQGGKHRP